MLSRAGEGCGEQDFVSNKVHLFVILMLIELRRFSQFTRESPFVVVLTIVQLCSPYDVLFTSVGLMADKTPCSFHHSVVELEFSKPASSSGMT